MESWELKQRNYATQLKQSSLHLSESDNRHPLLVAPEPQSKPSQKSTTVVETLDYDPLTGGSEFGSDPLTVGMVSTQKVYQDDEDEPIAFFTQDHLAKYSEKDMPANRFILRLEKLNNSDTREREEVHELSFQEVIELASQRKSELVEAWNHDERVKSLKIVIQLCKFLTDVTYPYLYPRLFAIVSQSLDLFGERVYERLCIKAFKTAQPGSFSPSEVDAKTKETAQNWLYKVSSIRELIPRIFVEAALLRIFSFLLDDPYSDTLSRLLQQTNGIGHPLISAYARSYIVKKGLETDRSFRESHSEDPMTALVFRAGAMLPSARSSASSALHPVNAGRGRTLQEQENERIIFKNNFDDFLFQLQNAKSEKRKLEMKELGIDFSKYLRVYSPCMQMLVTSVIRSNKHDDICATLLRLHETACPDSLLLYHLIELSPAKTVVNHIQTILERIRKDPGVAQFLDSVKKKKSEGASASTAATVEPIPSAYNLARLLSELGKRLCEAAPAEEDKLPLLNAIWKMATKLPDIQEYLLVARSFIKYPIMYCTDRDTQILLTDIKRHVEASEAFQSKKDAQSSPVDKDEEGKTDSADAAEEEPKKTGSLLSQAERVSTSLSTLPSAVSLLGDTLRAAAQTHKSIGTLLGMLTYQQLSDLLNEDESKLLGENLILAVGRPENPPITDSVTAYYLFEMSKKAFLWMDSFAPEDTVNKVDKALVQFTTKVDFGKDIEQQLTFYVDMRRVFPRFEQLKAKLVYFVNRLAMKTCQLVQFHHTKRTLNFVKGCVAYSHVTCPSVSDVGDRIRLLIDTAYIAFINNLVGQAEVLMKLMIMQIEAMPNIKTTRSEAVNTEPELIELISEICSLLVIAPGHPTYGAFVLVRLLLKMVSDYPWRNETAGKGIVLTRILSLLATLDQQSFPYHVKGVDSNDSLYAQLPEYKEELIGLFVETSTSVSSEIDRLAQLNTSESMKSCTLIGLQLAEVLTNSCVVSLAESTVVQQAIEHVVKAIGPPSSTTSRTIISRTLDPHLHLKNFMKHLQTIADDPDASVISKRLWTHLYTLQNPSKK